VVAPSEALVLRLHVSHWRLLFSPHWLTHVLVRIFGLLVCHRISIKIFKHTKIDTNMYKHTITKLFVYECDFFLSFDLYLVLV
jgi:hypothetical protein